MQELVKIVNGLLTNKYTEVFHEKDYKFNAPHHFFVYQAESNATCEGSPNKLAYIPFQEGPIKEVGVNGVHNEDLIGMVIARLQGFQASEYACEENANALNSLFEALSHLRSRTTKREARGVEGTHTV